MSKEVKITKIPNVIPTCVASFFDDTEGGYALSFLSHLFRLGSTIAEMKILGLSKEQFWISVLFYWLTNVSFASTAYLSRRFSDRAGRKIPITVGAIVLGIMSVGFAYAFNLASAGILFLMHVIYQGF